MRRVDALPATGAAGGVSLPVCCGFRRNVAAELVDRDAPGAASSLLWCLMATRGPDGRRSLPEEVAADPAPWLAAALEWHDAAMGAMPYGDPLAPDARAADGPRTFDWEADAALVTADFQRLYGLDLTDPACQVHWHRFCALLLAAVRTEGSLLSAALSARAPLGPGADRHARAEHRRRAEAWALPPTEDELRKRAMESF